MARGRPHKNDIVRKAAEKRRFTPPRERLPGEVVQVNLRMPETLRRALTKEAMASKRSLNAEMLLRLERSFERDAADDTLEEAKAIQAKTAAMQAAIDQLIQEAGDSWLELQEEIKRGK